MLNRLKSVKIYRSNEKKVKEKEFVNNYKVTKKYTKKIKGSDSEKIVKEGETTVFLPKVVHNKDMIKEAKSDLKAFEKGTKKFTKGEVLNRQKKIKDTHLQISCEHEYKYKNLIFNLTHSHKVKEFKEDESGNIEQVSYETKNGITPGVEISDEELYKLMTNSKVLNAKSDQSKIWNNVKEKFNWESEQDISDHLTDNGSY